MCCVRMRVAAEGHLQLREPLLPIAASVHDADSQVRPLHTCEDRVREGRGSLQGLLLVQDRGDDPEELVW